jgi:type IV secretion system protein VirB11
MTSEQAEILRYAVMQRRNVLIAGGTSTGKTTLVNALLAEVANTADRVVLIEDTRELQCKAPNLVALRTKDGVASLSDLVRSSLRLRPDRIPIGEVRGSEALDLLKAWGTGPPGGIGTIHAGSAMGALRRLEQLIQEAVVTVPRALIAETIDLIAVLAGRGGERRLVELAAVEGLGPGGDYVLTPAVDRASAGEPVWSPPLPARALSSRQYRPSSLQRSLWLPQSQPARTCRGSSRFSRSCNRSRGRSPRSSR